MKLLLPGAAAALAAFALAAPDAASAGGYYAGHPGYYGSYYAPQHFRPGYGYPPYAYSHHVIVAPAYHTRIIVAPRHGYWRDPRWSGHHWAPRHRFHCQAIGCTRWHGGHGRGYSHGFSGGVGYSWGW